MYSIYFLEENDNIRIVFDKLNLINDLIDLYKQINVIMLLIDANIKVSEIEKDMLMKILEKKTFKKKDDTNIRELLINIIKNVQDIQINKSKIDNEYKGTTLYIKPIVAPLSIVSNQVLDKYYEKYQPIIVAVNGEIKGDYPQYIDLRMSNQLKVTRTNNNVDNTLKKTILQNNTIDAYNQGTFNYTFLMDSWWNENKVEASKNSYCILYNEDNECCLFCDYTQKIKRISDEFGDFIIIREYNNIYDKCIVNLKELIHTNMYCDKILIEKKLDAFEELYDITKINEQDDEKSLIIFYIKQNYVISEDVTKRIKVSTLLEEVESELRIKNTNLRHNFANYLYDIGLQKKRYSDGMYLYGIESKASIKANELKNEKLTASDVKKLVNIRKNELDQIFEKDLNLKILKFNGQNKAQPFHP